MDETNIFYSYRVQEELLNLNNTFIFGKAHYSYKIVKNKFVNLLEINNIKVHEVIRPEIYKHQLAFKFLTNFRQGDIHLIFKPFDEMRILKTAYNIGIIAWEFNKINTVTFNSVPFSNHLRILSMLDEVWVLCEYTKKVLQQYHIKNVYCIPAPIEPVVGAKNISIVDLLGDLPALKLNTSSSQSIALTIWESPTSFRKLYQDIEYVNKTYLTIINPWDKRKNIENIISSFAEFSRKNQEALLIVKLIIDNSRTNLVNINEILSTKLGSSDGIKSPNIIFISENLTNIQMRTLMQSVEYYYCLSNAEGQNLPVLEAMSVGTVPVSVAHTAMADYIREDNSFIIKSKLEVAPTDSNASNNSAMHWYKPNLRSAISALEKSYNALPSDYQNKSDNSRKIVSSSYSYSAIFDKISQRIKTIKQS